MKRFQLAAGVLLATLSAGSAQAALIGVVQNYPDITLGQSTLIYDHNGVNATTGLLRVVSFSSTFNKASGAGGATSAQLYSGSGESPAIPDVMMSFAISNTTGAWVSNSTYNKVTIGFGNAAVASSSNFGFSWQGDITNFGFLNNGTQFDAKFTLTDTQYQNMPSGFTQFTSGLHEGMTGGIKINNNVAVAGSLFGSDWVRGSGVSSSTGNYQSYMASFITDLDAGASKLNSTVVVDAFVPLPAAVWMLVSGLGFFVPFVRRRKLQALAA